LHLTLERRHFLALFQAIIHLLENFLVVRLAILRSRSLIIELADA
jgi:hypothetical protein